MSAHEAHPPNREQLLAATSRPIPSRIYSVCTILAVIGALTFIAGIVMGEDRMWQAMQVNWLYFTLISSAGVAFVAVQRIATARWSRQIIRLLEGYVAFLPIAFVLLAVIVLAGRGHIFPWAHEAPTTHEKALYLSPTFFVLRTLIVFGIITVLSVWYIYTSLRLDVGHIPEAGAAWARGIREKMRTGFGAERRELHSTHSLQGLLAVFLIIAFGFGWSVLAWDMSMTLDPHFQSTLYGWWIFMGAWLGSLMSFTLLCMWWRKHLGAYDLILERHFHDLGKLCFGFTAFWGYLTFGQFLVIWYANMGEETHWPRLRLIAPWTPLSMTVVTLMFVFPFFGLLSRAAKVFLPTMAFFAGSSLIGLWIHRYLEVYPSLHPNATTVPFGLWEIGITLGFLGLWGWCYASFMDAFPRIRVTLLTSPYRDEVQVPVDPKTMEPLPAHE